MTIMQKFLWVIISIGNFSAGDFYMYNPGFLTATLLLSSLAFSLIGLYDVFYSPHSLNRLYPVVAYLRYFLESYRVEIQQYFVANDTEERPFNREQRTLVYQRAKNIRDTIAFGTQRDLVEDNYLSLWHSLAPTHIKDSAKRVVIGGDSWQQPYSASYLNISAMSFGS